MGIDTCLYEFKILNNYYYKFTDAGRNFQLWQQNTYGVFFFFAK